MRVGEALLDLLFPPKCPFCQRLLHDPRAPLCPNCQASLPWLTGRAGERRVDFTQGCWSPLAYQAQVREAVQRYKFAPAPAYGRPFGLLMAQCARDQGVEAELVTWAPLSKKRRRKRGFDQGELLARTVGECLALPVLPLLEKSRHTVPQSSLPDGAARRANALGAYSLLPGGRIEGRRVLLVDDVVTSGATLSECARLLCQGGAKQVLCLTLAQAGEGGDKLENNRNNG
ncbi:ComF family protein [Muriventricola aceti]|uniref:ComF family protein n=1 Tax=Muriventricola aceti TaxID=2981773 RepID=UPI0008204A6B|nr:ComF family protein [Muriventricola aceti]MBS5590470.1 ComF family protein [Clostridiales bacterium]MCU6701627.1 ComF family protein [Muriventricola aceti]SCI70460.1 DNA utilization protein GntX [uncultured Flavonifractor sp.]